MSLDLSPLTYLLALAFGGTLLTFFAGSRARWIALATAVGTLGISIWLLANFQLGLATDYQFVQVTHWLTLSTGGSAGLAVNYTVGIDGISLPFLLLSAILTLVTVIYHWDERKNPAGFFGLVGLTNAGLLGVFVALDVLLFFAFWEIVLIPMFFLIGHWGGTRRHYASLKFFVYTHVASVVTLVSLFAMVFLGNWGSMDFGGSISTADVAALNVQSIPQITQVLMFGALFFGFGVKLPMVPFHTWLPDAHVEAPTGGSVLLAGMLLKMGAYGLIRIAFPLLPYGHVAAEPVVLGIAFLSIVWGAFLSLAQRDLKRMVAFSSINHMGIVLLAIALWTQLSVTAAVLLMFAHGLVSGLLFLLSGSVHHTFGTRDIPSIGGITSRTPILSTMLIIGSLASLGLPSLVSFPAEFSAFLATWEALGWWILLPLFALVITAGFYLWMLQRLSFGPAHGIPEKARDLPFNEMLAMGLLVSLIVLYGILPYLIVQLIPHSAIFATQCFHGGSTVCATQP
ncbi:MAG: NADH-quinone oxidoreductase subunit M [Candidatus Thermoplasmatota archaeon]|jgi:NADH-quinone oxidoreductase subunit M|nr:NADH-quinone oxidoreductase subunit M [Candidatus Thermoplasmatota archaeon]